ncbi:Vitamin K epoxide reductase family protein [Caulifigura coniformis]|uniref:Vitamin K epoxide reductase family protein n=1 Tax=Caulifigura coniformis TaxID=2527983 RepID=A0A517S9C6_9PLAN|nr:vitamin K epoxide reductase family protein [Caulifigura coniformis]QDT52725.1 Vitamin K epoxide reductase family protein [Caulifigura coniformis]
MTQPTGLIVDVESSQPLAASAAKGTKRLTFVRVLALVAIAVTSAQVVDHFAITAPFCGGDLGCSSVTSTGFARPLGIPLSVLGLGAFTAYLGLSLMSGRPARTVLGWASIVAGAVGIGLILVQKYQIQQYCPLCLVIDSAGILMAVTDFFFPLAVASPATGRRGPWISAAAVLAMAPAVWFQFQPDPVAPDYVRERWIDGKVNIVEVFDFDCVFCRDTHPVLKEVLAKAGDDIHFVRIPLAMDPNGLSKQAGQIYLAAERTGTGEQVADKLMEGEQLTQELITAAGGSEATANEAIGAEIDRANAAYHASSHKGLPQIWVNNLLLIGASEKGRIEAAIGKARSKVETQQAKQQASEPTR